MVSKVNENEENVNPGAADGGGAGGGATLIGGGGCGKVVNTLMSQCSWRSVWRRLLFLPRYLNFTPEYIFHNIETNAAAVTPIKTIGIKISATFCGNDSIMCPSKLKSHDFTAQFYRHAYPFEPEYRERLVF